MHFLRNLRRGATQEPTRRVYHDIIPRHTPVVSVRKRRTRSVFIGLTSVVLVAFALSAVLPGSILRADTLVLHPSACLGGWNEPRNAEGSPEALAYETPYFSSENSAVLPENTAAEIFCGGFVADIPPQTEPKTLTLKLSWSVTQGAAPPVVTGEDFMSSIGELFDAPNGSSFELEIPANPEKVENSEVMEEPVPIEESTPATDPEPAPEAPAPEQGPTSFLDFFIPTAHAQENFLEEVHEEIELVSTTTESVSAPSESSFVEVRYTLDGVSWYSLGTFGEEEVVPTLFSIPIPPQTTWTDLSNFQVSIRTLPTLDAAPLVYLDGMELQVGYDAATITRFFADKPAYSLIDAIQISSATPHSAVEIYWTNNPDTAPEASNVYAAIIGDDGTVRLDAYTLFPGQFVLVNTTDKWHCAHRSLSSCRTQNGYLGETAIRIVSTPAEITSMANTTATTTSEVGEDASIPEPVEPQPGVESEVPVEEALPPPPDDVVSLPENDEPPPAI